MASAGPCCASVSCRWTVRGSCGWCISLCHAGRNLRKLEYGRFDYSGKLAQQTCTILKGHDYPGRGLLHVFSLAAIINRVFRPNRRL